MTGVGEPLSQETRRILRRSRVVCTYCHEKKIKCDIQNKRTGSCSKCAELGFDCLIRPSRRNKKRFPVGDGTSTHLRREVEPQKTALGNETSDYTVPDAPGPAANLSSWDFSSTPNLNDCSPASVGSSAQAVASYVGHTGYLHIFKGDGAEVAVTPAANLTTVDVPSPVLQESYLETYFKRCYALCPVLDRVDDGDVPALANSAMLQNALALLGSHIEPPVIAHATPAEYYERAKKAFYGYQENNPLLALLAIMLFYWWGYGPPDVVSIDTVWWWTGVAIRQAQQMGLHREPKPGQTRFTGETPGLRRRVWWTLFARERLTSICTGRPLMINLDDCSISELSISDYPTSQSTQAEIHIYWVKLCAIIGRVSQYLSRRTESTPFPVDLTQELKEWIGGLPHYLQLPISGPRTISFNADIHQMHLCYLATVSLLYLSGGQESLPKAYTAAVLAACCTARIFEDFTARGSMRFLQGIVGWEISVAILALLHARRVPRLTQAADDHIAVLRIALKEMGKTWVSARMFDRGFDRMNEAKLLSRRAEVDATSRTNTNGTQTPVFEISDHFISDSPDRKDFFPFLTTETSNLAALLLTDTPHTLFGEMMPDWHIDLAAQFQEFFAPFGDFGVMGFPE